MSAAQTLVSLAEVLAQAPAEHELRPGFRARLAAPLVGGDVADEADVRTVLERTAVVDLGQGRRRLARIPDVLVEREAMAWVPVVPISRRRLWVGKHPDEDVGEELAAQRAVSDERARGDQDRRQRELDEERRQLRTAAAAAAAPASEVVVSVGDQDDSGELISAAEASGEEVAPAPPATAVPDGERTCGSCGRLIPPHNRAGICGLCRLTCPGCGGAKAAQAERCRRCARPGRRRAKPAEAVLEVAPAGKVLEGPVDVRAAGAAEQVAAAADGAVALDDGPDEAPDPGGRPGAGDEVLGAAIAVASVGESEEADVEATVAPDVVPIPEPELGIREESVVPEGARFCRRCDTQLPAHNRKGLCTACQGVCPSCGGRKALEAERCRACRREEPPGPASAGLSFAAAMEDLPEMVRELREQLITVAEYARGLEDELADYRAAELRRSRGQ
jgi:hypothetical protein